ncbi:MAG: GNAT family N-acetyltransferase [Euryarchaeota archaeon]|nr:GNAT family N-acetyltransferase [Euryarchaeota archaeon]MDE1835318.1 GNAT family N-acetyltransferase [Euryarchaeota archaeon]MDE1880589.1 GNAT family N-acetyltransferase [Euryarchaeota archaeon]MDE2043614.1 GNAT family N-acetyltransferase [Thermoplasmata archaeon]
MTNPPCFVRDLRKGERRIYQQIVVSEAGEFDRRSGLLDLTERDFRPVLQGPTWSLLALLRVLHRTPVRFLAAERDGKLIGTTLLLFQHGWSYVAAVGVLPSERGKGVGAELVRTAQRWSLERGRRRMALDVDSTNATAIALYRRHGWVFRKRWVWSKGEASGPPRGATKLERSSELREATKEEVATARSVQARATTLPLRGRWMLPVELALSAQGWSRDELVAGQGPRGLLARIWTRPDSPNAYVLVVPMAEGSSSTAPEATLATLVRGALERSRDHGASRTFLITEEGQALSPGLQAELSLSMIARTETWTRDLASTS